MAFEMEPKPEKKLYHYVFSARDDYAIGILRAESEEQAQKIVFDHMKLLRDETDVDFEDEDATVMVDEILDEMEIFEMATTFSDYSECEDDDDSEDLDD